MCAKLKTSLFTSTKKYYLFYGHNAEHCPLDMKQCKELQDLIANTALFSEHL